MRSIDYSFVGGEDYSASKQYYALLSDGETKVDKSLNSFVVHLHRKISQGLLIQIEKMVLQMADILFELDRIKVHVFKLGLKDRSSAAHRV
jgi:hypothetical protein